MILTPDDIHKEARKQRAEMLGDGLRVRLENLRQALEARLPLEGVGDRDEALALLDEYATLVLANESAPARRVRRRVRLTAKRRPPARAEAPLILSAVSVTGTDQESLQAFRRAAWNDLELLEARLHHLSDGAWRTNADEVRSAKVGDLSLKLGFVFVMAAIALVGWWYTQQHRREALSADLDKVKAVTAFQAVRFISLAAWLAEDVQGKPLSEIARDMRDSCSGLDTRTIAPDNPCREEWARNRSAIFLATIPEPGKPVDAPSQIFVDPWGSPYILLFTQNAPPRIVSPGPDGILGTDDDIGTGIPYWR